MLDFEGYHLYVSWDHREESLDVCTDKSWEFLQEYMKIAPYPIIPFYAYKFKGKQEVLNREFVYKALKKGTNKKDFPKGEIIPELGFTMSLHSQQPKFDIRIHCGCYGEGTESSVIITFPSKAEDTALFYQEDFLKKAFELMVHIWNPDYGRVWDLALARATDQFDNKSIDIDVGWLTYLSSRYGELPKLPDWTETTKRDGLGTIISATEHLADAENREDVLKVLELSTLLDPFYKKMKNHTIQNLEN